MSLEHYRRPRMVVLNARSTAREAARAMTDNHIGSVLVTEQKQIVGIVTDRDLAAEVVGAGIDPNVTPLHDVMSDDLAMADIGATVDDVVRLMREHACRRVPLTEHGKPVGLVTLDDLLLDGAIDAQTAASIVRAQLEVLARYKREGAVHPEIPARPGAVFRGDRAITRHAARAETSYAKLLRAVERFTGLQNAEKIETALDVVLSSVCRRVTPQEARHVIAQLPSKLQPGLSLCLEGPDRRVTLDSIQNELARRLDVSAADSANLLFRLCEAVADCVSMGQLERLRGQLPLEMKDLFPAPVRRSA